MPLSFDWPFPEKPSILYKAVSTITIGLVGSFSKFWMKYLSSVRIENGEFLLNAVLNRHPDRPLITVANHHSCMDDPLLIAIVINLFFNRLFKYFLAATIPLRVFWTRHRMRWALGADDIVFTMKKHQLFFSLGKTIPVTRGDGVYQRPMNFALEQLNQGGWIHIFSEGKVNLTKEPMRLKWGVGRLVAEADICPLVVPLYHIGMDDVLPNVEPYALQIGKKVSIYVGEPLIFDGLVEEMKKEKRSLQEIRKAVTDIIQNELYKLKVKCEELHRQHLGSDSSSSSS